MESVLEYITKFIAIIMQILALFGYGQDKGGDAEPAE